MKKITTGPALMLEFPEKLFAKKTANSPAGVDNIGKYYDVINEFVTVRVAPDTVTGLVDHVLTTEKRLEDYCKLQRAYTDPNYPDYIDLLKEFANVGVKFRSDYPRKVKGPGKDEWYFQLNLFIKVENVYYETETTPVGLLNSVGTGENMDAVLGAQRTWKQWMRFNRTSTLKDDQGVEVKVPRFSHKNDTHKFFFYGSFNSNTITDSEYKTLLLHTNTETDSNLFDVLSNSELQAQIKADSE